MEVKYLSFGNLCIRLETPERLLSTQAFEAFFGEEKESDFTFKFSFCDGEIELPKNSKTTEYGNLVFCLEKEKRFVCYKAAAEGEYYAVRECRRNSSEFDVTLTKNAKGKLWTRLALNTLGVDELAAQKDGAVFHSSFIERDGKAVLFTGPCQIGKSTQARLWNEFQNTPIINGDKTLIYLENGKAFASGLPFSGSSGISFNRSMELCAIIRLEKGEANSALPLSPSEAFRCLLRSSYIAPGCGDAVSRNLSEIAARVPVYSFECTADQRAVEALDAFLKGE